MSEHKTHKTINGVDVDQLFGTVDVIKDKPDVAKFKFRAQNRWVNGGHNRTTVKDFYGAGKEDTSRTKPFVFEEDEPPILLGEDHGANPVEYALTALAGCLTTSLVYHAAARGIKIDEVESKLEGDLDLRGFLGMSENVRNGYDNIRVTFNVKADAPKEEIEKLVELAQKRSPVFDIVSNPVPVSVKLEEKN
ncbi:MAG: OsmC family peroxiredoxin [Proteobacteria bacterium]|nr:OsmC family peroxiredoxin [Pseudomonadota bacterium]